jgi:TetR/AcrR family transcriptional regulator, cholesterol catabolism regulator
MTGTAPRRTGTRAAETAARKARLVDAATELAAEGGYESVQMRDVASRADVALGTLYRHFSSKDQLLLAALKEQAADLHDALDRRPPIGSTPAERVADVLRRASRALERNPKVTGALVAAMFVNDPAAAAQKSEVREQLNSMLSRALDGHEVDDLDGVIDVLGHCWIATLAFWASGLGDGTPMGDRLERAAHLLLDERQ